MKMAKFCPECGTPRMENAKFCVTCGYAFEGAPTNPFIGLGMPSNSFIGMGALTDLGSLKSVYPGNGRFFRYNETFSAFLSGRTYQAWEEDEVVKVLVRHSGKEEKDAPVFETDREFMDRLELMMKSFPLEEWNGFSASGAGVMDGQSLSFTYRDKEGNTTAFSSYVAAPTGFAIAYRLFSDWFEDLYDKHFPDPKRSFGKYLDQMAMDAGGFEHTGKYYAFLKKQTTDTPPETMFQNGRIGCRIMNFPKSFGHPNLGAATATVVREPSGEDSGRFVFKLILSYHTLDENLQGKCIYEALVEEDLFSCDALTVSAFTHDTIEKHYFGCFIEKEYTEGDIERTCKMVISECTDHVIRPCGEAFVRIPRDKTGFGPESISDLITLAEACNLPKTVKDMTDNPAVPKLSIYEKNGFANIETRPEDRTSDGVIVKISSYA